MNSQGPRVVKFIEEFLTLGGSFYGQPFEVLDFQREVIDDIYKLDEDGRRIHRTYLLGLPRKNGKTLLAAALGVLARFMIDQYKDSRLYRGLDQDDEAA